MYKQRITGCLAIVILIAVFTRASAQREFGGMYTKERIANLRNNCDKYVWGKKLQTKAIANAKHWITISDEQLWGMVPGQALPRCIDVTLDRRKGKTKAIGCLVCGKKIFSFGNYPYEPDILNKPWKLTCPSCHNVFPTNDFGKYYQSGIDETGVFNPAKADRKLLYNTAHPDPKDPLHMFGVDDGYGYIDKDDQPHRFIGYFTYKYWDYLLNGIALLADAYLYTGDKIYAHKAAILLDRIADVYPDMEWKPYADAGWYNSDGGSNLGKIGGSISETGLAQSMATSYDKILSGTENDQQLYQFLLQQSKKYKLKSEKGTRKLLVDNIDEGILRTAFQAVLSKKIRGNQGMHQLTVATCAIALNTAPETTEWLDWLFSSTGGNIPWLMVNTMDHDGSTDEGAPNYTFLWGKMIARLADELKHYPAYTHHDIFKEFPHITPAFLLPYRLAIHGKAIPNSGDSGATGLVSSSGVDPQFMAQGYRYTRDPEIAVAAYKSNGNSAEVLGRDIYAADPDALSREIKQVAENTKVVPQNGYLVSGFGLAVLGADNKSSISLALNYGRTIKHAHPDMLNFDIWGFNNWLAPDQGYPEFATNWPSNQEWTGSTLSHNTVLVNKTPQKEIWSGKINFFKQLNGFAAVEIDGKKAYPGLKTYTRTMCLISSDSDAYAVDIVRVAGGDDHVYGFHGPPGLVNSEGLNLQLQTTGTYAGVNIEKGAKAAEGNFPIGYSYLYNVRADKNPPAQFMLDWKAAAGYRNVSDKDDIHLRYYALNQSADVALADGDPPQNKPGNPRKLDYVLIHNQGNNLNSTFVSVIEPYKTRPFIKSVKRLDDGKSTYVYLKVELMNGNTDLVLYNSLTDKTIKLANGPSMNGMVGYVRENDGKALAGALINGTSLAYNNFTLHSTGPLTGKVVTMNKQLSGGGWIVVDTKLPTDGSLNGQPIMVAANSERDACYTITSVEKYNNGSKIFCGPISFVRGSGESPKQYLYDFDEGAPFQIPSHAIWDSNITKE